MGQDGEFFGQVDYLKTLKQTKRGDSGVEIESGRETDAEGKANSFEGIHCVFEFSKEHQEQRLTAARISVCGARRT